MTTPNTALRTVRLGMLMSQDDFARAVRQAGEQLGRPNDANKRLVQRWEAGTVTVPRPAYARALEAVCGMPVEALGFAAPSGRVTPDGVGGHDVEGPALNTGPTAVGVSPHPPHSPYSGVWLSRYEYFSSGRNDSFTSLHYVLLLQHGNRLTVRSLPGSAPSSVTMDITVDGNVLTGTWTEATDPHGYYRGARYHGTIQLIGDPTGRRLRGKWLGFGKDGDVNTGPWEFIFQDASTTRAAIEKYNRRPREGGEA